MADEPSYPKDAGIGSTREQRADTPSEEGARTKTLVTGVAMGIGSAALVAALLYATRGKKPPRGS